MSNSFDGEESRPDSSQETEYITDEAETLENSGLSGSVYSRQQPEPVKATVPLAMVETAFLASTASLIWLLNYYFPLGPLLRIFFPVPIALIYLRWGSRASWMSALVSGLLLSVLMGPPRSIQFVIPYALMGVQLGAMWRRQSGWVLSIAAGTIIGTFGFFFRIGLVSILVGQDIWVYMITQVTEILEFIFVKLGWLVVPSLPLVQASLLAGIIVQNILYVFVVHLVALLLLDRLGNPIPRPPEWVQVMLDYE